MKTRDAIVNDLVINQPRYKSLTEDVYEFRNSMINTDDKELKVEVELQFKNMCYRIIGDQVSVSLGVPLEQVFEVLDDISLMEYLNVGS